MEESVPLTPSSSLRRGLLSVGARSFSLWMVFAVCACSVVYGLATTENTVQLFTRSDLTPLYLSLGPNAWCTIPKLLFASFICLTPGELTVCCILLITTSRLERTIGFFRMLQLVVVLTVGRVLVVLAWCSLVVHETPLLVRVRPSVLWLCVSLLVIRTCLLRSTAPFIVLQILPLNNHMMPHLLGCMLMWQQRCSFWDTTLPSVLIGLVLCTPLVGIHRWPRGRLGNLFSVQLRKSWKAFPSVDVRTPRTAATSSNSSRGREGSANNAVRGRRLGSRPGLVSVAQEPQLARAQPRPSTVTVAAPAPSILTLVDMGFSEQDSLRALEVAHGDVNEAASLLLEGRV